MLRRARTPERAFLAARDGGHAIRPVDRGNACFNALSRFIDEQAQGSPRRWRAGLLNVQLIGDSSPSIVCMRDTIGTRYLLNPRREIVDLSTVVDAPWTDTPVAFHEQRRPPDLQRFRWRFSRLE